MTIGALRYRCACQAEYLISIPASAGPEWKALVAAVADSIGAQPIDSAKSTFVCERCGRVHGRGAAGAAA